MDQEIAWTAVELLDVVARRGTKKKGSLLRRSLRPKAASRKKPVSIDSAEAAGFFGQFPKPSGDPATPDDGPADA